MSIITEHQNVTISSGAQECPICMDTIEVLGNRVVTECGHAFHCSCLMQNIAHNGFGCPYCRSKMADEPEEEYYEEDDEDDDSIEVATVFEEDALISFRMFHQQNNGEEVEEDPEQWGVISWSDEEEDDMPDATYMAEKLDARGITYEDLVKNILYQEHSDFGEKFVDYERRSSEVYGQFKAIISQYIPPVVVATPVLQHSNTIINHETLPVIAEPKSAVIPRRRELNGHI